MSSEKCERRKGRCIPRFGGHRQSLHRIIWSSRQPKFVICGNGPNFLFSGAPLSTSQPDRESALANCLKWEKHCLCETTLSSSNREIKSPQSRCVVPNVKQWDVGKQLSWFDLSPLIFNPDVCQHQDPAGKSYCNSSSSHNSSASAGRKVKLWEWQAIALIYFEKLKQDTDHLWFATWHFTREKRPGMPNHSELPYYSQ